MSSRRARFELHRLFEALDAERKERGLSWAETARQISRLRPGTKSGGISPSTITSLRTARVAEADGVLQMLLWLNRTPESFLAVNHSSNGSMPALKESGILRMDTPRIYEAIQERRAARSMTWKDVENEMGIPASILQHFAKGGRAEFRTVVEVAIWLGRPVMEFTKTSPR